MKSPTFSHKSAASSLMYLLIIIITWQYSNVLDIHFSWFMAVREQICLNYSVKVKVNRMLICCTYKCECMRLCPCVWCGFVGRTQTSSGERKCEQVRPLLAGVQHHMEIRQQLVVLDTRYHTDSAWWGNSGASAVMVKSKSREHGVEQKDDRMTECV